ELILADMETVDNRIPRVEKLIKHGDKLAAVEYEGLQKLKMAFEAEQPARNIDFPSEEKEALRHLHLLTMKPVLYVANVSEEEAAESENNPHVQNVMDYAAQDGSEVVVISAKIEAEIAELGGAEKAAFLEDLGIPE